MARDQFVIELAQTVNEMFAKGYTDPSADEIAKAHFPDYALAPEIIESIRKRLHRIREVLETVYEHPVYLLSYIYYSRFRRFAPMTDADARRCVPGIGPGARVEGIRLHTDGDKDRIYQAMFDQNYSSGARKVRRQSNRVLSAVEDHRLEEPHAASIMRRGMDQASPDNIKLARKVMASAPRKENAQQPLLAEYMIDPKGKANGTA
jgi:hypothetical protein